MWHHLDGLAQVVAMTLTIDHGLIDATCCYRVVSCCVYACKPFIMTQIEVCLHTIDGHIALAMLVGIQRPRVDVDIGVKLLDGDFIAACLQQLTDAGGDNSLA